MFIAFAYIHGVSCKGIKHWNTGINQQSIKLLSNLKTKRFHLIVQCYTPVAMSA